MIDEKSVKNFWDSRAQKYLNLPYESIANLEQDPINLQLKIKLETEKIFSLLGDIRNKTILDLGAGVGQWSFRFSQKNVKKVVSVEYSENLVQIARKELTKENITNVKFITSSAENFIAKTKFDIVFISGLFVYMNDEQAKKLMENIPHACHPKTLILVRDGMALSIRYEINNRFSEHLQTDYSAIYRTRDEYVQMFNKSGFKLFKDENMFEEGCPLNKYPETRLHVFLFEVN